MICLENNNKKSCEASVLLVPLRKQLSVGCQASLPCTRVVSPVREVPNGSWSTSQVPCVHVGYLRVILLLVQAEDSSVYRLARTMFSRLPDLGPGWMPRAEDAVSAEMTTYFHVTPAGKKRHGCPLETRPARAFLFFPESAPFLHPSSAGFIGAPGWYSQHPDSF